MRITYYVQRYRPRYEAISKEVEFLANHFSQEHQVKIHDLHLDGLWRAQFNHAIVSYHFAYYPFLFPYFFFLNKKSQVNHLYTSLGDLPYLPFLELKKTVLTAAASCSFEKIKKRIFLLQKLARIVVQSRKQQQQLLSLGINSKKIKLLPPPLALEKFSFSPVKETAFTVLYASCPTRKEDFKKRGIFLLLETAKALPQVRFHLAWREGAYQDIQKLLHQENIPNVFLENNIVANPNELYALAHCTIIPYTHYDDFLKLMPNSAIESLAAGKPLLLSAKTEMGTYVQKEKCGLVIQPTALSLISALQQLQKEYSLYQKNCRRTAEKYFSAEKVLQFYHQLYDEVAL